MTRRVLLASAICIGYLFCIGQSIGHADAVSGQKPLVPSSDHCSQLADKAFWFTLANTGDPDMAWMVHDDVFDDCMAGLVQ